MKKILIILIITLLVLVTGFYFYKSKKITVQELVPTPTPVVETKLNKFKSDILGFEVTISNNLVVEEKTAGKVVMIGDRILIYELSEDPEKCKGVCSVLTKKEDMVINEIEMRYLEGYWEELGEDNAQNFVSYVISRKDKYLVFMLQELPIDSIFEKNRKVEQINEEKFTDLKKIVESIRLI